MIWFSEICFVQPAAHKTPENLTNEPGMLASDSKPTYLCEECHMLMVLNIRRIQDLKEGFLIIQDKFQEEKYSFVVL